jgi:hypothetical protein
VWPGLSGRSSGQSAPPLPEATTQARACLKRLRFRDALGQRGAEHGVAAQLQARYRRTERSSGHTFQLRYEIEPAAGLLVEVA